jgi:hypothetical protein
LIIQRLKQEVAELKAEIKFLKGANEDREHLTPEESEDCRRMAEEFANARDPSVKLVLSDMLKINECFFHLKKMIISGKGHNNKASEEPSNEEVERLRLLVQQRDNEIAILLNQLSKQKNNPSDSYSIEETKVTESPTKRSVDMNTRIKERSFAESRLTIPTNIQITPEELQDRNKAFEVFRRSYKKKRSNG